MSASIDIQPYLRRREALLAQMGDGVAIIPTSPEVVRNRDAHYAYRHDSYFYYLTGFVEPEALLVLVGGATPKSILFCREKNAEREIWDGYRYGPEAAASVFGFDEAHAMAKLDELLPDWVANRDTLFASIGQHAAWDQRVAQCLNVVRGRARTGVWAPSKVVDVRSILDEMRLIKDPFEQSLMRRAAEISAHAHRRAMAASKPSMFEYEIEAELLHEFVKNGAREQAYGAIVASGPNACCLHYRDNNRFMQDGELLLIDAGCEFQGYASDITRTWPISGRFSGPQRDVYQAVLDAQLACMDVLKPGHAFNAYHDVATRRLAQSLIDLGLCHGSLDAVIESKSYEQFYMHRAGHWLGMDVHDAGDYRNHGQWRALHPGMVLTNEPGLYIRPADNVPEAFWNIGVRIEDDVLITASGNEVLTAFVPKTVEAVEAAVQGR